MIEISVVIGTYNLKDKLSLVLDSLSHQTLNPSVFEVIIVDSNSNDGTDNLCTNNKYPFLLKYIKQDNKGKTAARNRGIREASSELILITDADMIADKRLLEEHINLQKKHKKNIIIEGKTYVLTDEKLPAKNHIRRPYITHKVKHEQKLDFYYCLTGNLSMPKHFFEQANYFDEKFQNYGWEDIDLGYRLKKMNKKIIFSERAINYHYHVWSDYEEIIRRQKMGESVHIIIQKHPKLKTFLGVNIVNKMIFLFGRSYPKLIQNWLEQIKQEKTSKIKKILLREFYFQKGYFKNN